MVTEFEGFQKIPRLMRDVIVTEKIDGTNAQIMLVPEEEYPSDCDAIALLNGYYIYAGSRTRWLDTSSKAGDNHGFAKWVKAHAVELVGLGEGRHFGEWWGQGIQRNYSLPEKRFSLFNVARWGDERPACCHVVPVLYQGVFHTEKIKAVLRSLERDGSTAAPGFMKPEGIIVYHTAARNCFKQTIESDEQPKEKV